VNAKHEHQLLIYIFFLLSRRFVELINRIGRSQRTGKNYFTESSSAFLYSYAIRHVTHYRRASMRPNWTIFWLRRCTSVHNYARERKNVKNMLVYLKSFVGSTERDTGCN
jgi:hypothetical protein